MIDLNHLTKIQRDMLNVINKYGKKWVTARDLGLLLDVQTQKIAYFLKVLKVYGKVECTEFHGYDERGIFVVKRLWRIKKGS